MSGHDLRTKRASPPCSGTDVLSHPAPLSLDHAFAESAPPFIRKPKFFPNSRRAPFEKIFAVWICRERELNGSIIQDFAGHESYKFVNVSAYLIAKVVRKMQKKV